MSEPTCIGLRPWAKANRYRWRYEEGHSNTEPDAEWYVEVICRHGLIYPKGGNTLLLAYANRGVKPPHSQSSRHRASPDRWQRRGLSVERLDEVAAILKPKRLKGSAKLTSAQLANLQEGRKRLEKQRQESPEQAESQFNTQS